MSVGSIGGASSAGQAQAAEKPAIPLFKVKRPGDSSDSAAAMAVAAQVINTAQQPPVNPLAQSSHAVQAAVSSLKPGGTSSA